MRFDYGKEKFKKYKGKNNICGVGTFLCTEDLDHKLKSMFALVDETLGVMCDNLTMEYKDCLLYTSFFKPTLIIDCAKTVAVVVPSPASSPVLEATSFTIWLL